MPRHRPPLHPPHEAAVPAAARPTVRGLRDDLSSARPLPLPPWSWPRGLRWLPHTLVVLAAVAVAATGADPPARLLAVGHAACWPVALRRPVPAWWLSTAFFVVIAVAHPPTPANEVWAWTVQAGALFLLALRVRPTSAAVAAGIGAAVGVVLKLTGGTVGSWDLVLFGLTLFAVAVLVGGVARGRREDRARLAAQIAATARERAVRTVLEERARIARELHDVVAHHLSLISIQADAAPYRVPDPPPELAAEFASIRANALEGLAELRHLLGLLRADAPGEGAAVTAPQPSLAELDALLAHVRAAGLAVAARVEGARRPLPPGVELSAYRIVQEALSNTLRHAPGAGAEVELRYAPTALRLRVTNGPAVRAVVPAPGGGHGLTGMRERAAMLAGDVVTGPLPDGGWEVTAVLPVRPAPAPTTDKDSPA
ncbi:sensor histidine kinase [Streptomyces spectabilis]|uniref:histidine kinase n=1 Tax=Streptomyces spectabilis TaxID=68270 RepID=A0A5P2X6G5_STRST|nr:sensor histidine kinase [Streptomyces spectabilis]MBB5101402.1 signal transduction histidine kinase [Streptomyces spectabilis]MCI3900598.1 sensor histidine kinase [Streptomyces spectabilis]QEV58156.1 sensor histidine kinase [Streptomyces spectabilis]GGV11175.1 two-component sensor histidine kinase [Streptomyces spectabilis]